MELRNLSAASAVQTVQKPPDQKVDSNKEDQKVLTFKEALDLANVTVIDMMHKASKGGNLNVRV